jgi:uncharacterized heparinase superfamily protein
LIIDLYFNTVRQLKLKQVFFQIIRRIYHPKFKPYLLEPITRNYDNKFIDACPEKNSLTNNKIFKFYGEAGNLLDIGWDGNEKEKLWRFNQHYFNDLNAPDSNNRIDLHKDLIQDWISSNHSKDSVGFHAYPLSLRIVNWIKWELREKNLSSIAIKSLFAQGILLEKSIEHHISGNHLFANAKALIFLGCYFDGLISQRWLNKGLKIVFKELQSQILDDGGNFELSPMYHCIFFKDCLDILNILRTFNLEEDAEVKNVSKLLKLKIPKMNDWINTMTFDDKKVPNFNDSASNIGPSPSDIRLYAIKMGFKFKNEIAVEKINIKHLKDSGYISVQKNDTKILIDVAKLGPDHLLAHGHADSLSFELAKQQKSIFINSGTSCYGTSDRRMFERSTRAHNTVEINETSSSQVWSTFRVAKRAYPYNLKICKNTDSLNIECSHDGYQKILNSSLNHTRFWEIDSRKIIIQDNVKGKYESAIARFIIDPNASVKKIDDNKFIIENNGVEIEFVIKIGTVNLINWESTNNFGYLESTKCFEVGLIRGISNVEII